MTKIHLHDSLTKTKREFTPLDGNTVKMYTCGLTVYHHPHIGHARRAIFADLLHRVLARVGNFDVREVKNFTDVGHLTDDDSMDSSGEDKFEKRARETGRTAWDIADAGVAEAREFDKKLRILEPFARPRATDFIPEQKNFIIELLQKDFAYVTRTAVYFDITKFQNYGKLSGNTLKNLKIAVRDTIHTDDEKRNPQDFALWFFCIDNHENHSMRWDSPTEFLKKASDETKKEWGSDENSECPKNSEVLGAREQRSESYAAGTVSEQHSEQRQNSHFSGIPSGFPGWHIECSAMARKLLGDQIDIHTGGIDNKFPHHECEIAQTEALTGKNFSNFWLHNAHLALADGEKMSKSKGEFITLDDIEKRGFSVLDLRFFMLRTHYRKEIRFSWDELERAGDERKNFQKIASKSSKNETDSVEKLKTVLADDLNISAALAVIHENTKTAGRDLWEFFDSIFDIFDENWQNTDRKPTNIPEEIKTLAEKRQKARTDKNWALSDEIRDKITAMGYEILDTAGKYEIKPK